MSQFSDFIRNATPEEKEKVYSKVMNMATLRQRMVVHGCRRSAVANMDHMKGSDPADLVPTVNRLCMTCYQHWYGPRGEVKEYTRAEWDALMATAFNEDLAQART